MTKFEFPCNDYPLKRVTLATGRKKFLSLPSVTLHTRSLTASKTLSGDDIKGKFYEPELQKIDKHDQVYIVEKILKTRKRAGKIEYFVKWRSYPNNFNSWVTDVSAV